MNILSDGSRASGALRTLRAAQDRDGSVPLEKRRATLEALRRMIVAEADAITDAISRDFQGRSKHETRISEIAVTLSSIDYALPRLKRWSRPERVRVGWQFWPAIGRIVKQPIGVVGVIAPWNYPLQLAIVPLVAAVAAGCRVVVKPSEQVPATTRLLCHMIDELDQDLVIAIDGHADEAAAMSALAFDKIFFTGSTETGRLVMRAAAENLVPTVLELGGKSPAIIDRSADLAKAATDIIAGKLLNAGQTCVATDYVFVPREQMGAFVNEARLAAQRLYPDLVTSDYTSICRPLDRERLTALCADHETVPLFERELAAPKLSPALVIGPSACSRLMRDEIFGPILPVIPYDDVEDVYRQLRGKPDPLALYWFGRDKRRMDEVIERTRSGGVAINDTVVHVAVEGLPFGGLGQSGTGAYHGRSGFDAFTHRRAVFVQHKWSLTRLLRPPYGVVADRIIRGMIR